MTAREAERELRNTANALRREVRRATKDCLGIVLSEARSRSTGPYSTRQLAAMDHPYARRHGSPRLPAEVINVQTGGFLRRWRTAGPVPHGTGYRGSVRNDADYAGYLDTGTKRMFRRPVADAALSAARPACEARVEAALDAALEG